MTLYGCVTVRPDECWQELVSTFPPKDLRGWLEVGAHGGASVSYVCQGILAPTPIPNGVHVFGSDSAADAALRSQIAEKFDGLSAEQITEGLLEGAIWEILFKIVKDRIKDPAILDLMISLGRKALAA